MFSNLIYLIIVLLIYTTCQPSEETNFTLPVSLSLFIGLIVIFAYYTRLRFQGLEKQLERQDFYRLGHKFDSIIGRLSVMAIMIFAVDIYGLNLSSFLINIPVFSIIPTFPALVFLGLFIFYLVIIWFYAYRAYQKLNMTDISRRSYILSNISFSIPVLLPWLLLTGIADIINTLPFEVPKRFLATTQGEIIYFLFFLAGIAIVGPVMIQKFWRCKPLEAGQERNRIEHLCKKAGMEYANILRWPMFGARMITAGVMGLVKKFRYILVTDELLRLLDPEEIDAVIAHEIGHIKRKHLLYYLLFFAGYMLLSYSTFDLLVYFIIYAEPLFVITNMIGFNQAVVTSTIFSIITILLFIVYFRYIFGFFMRNFERQADIYIYSLFETAKPLISTFKKIAFTSGQPLDRPNWHHFSIKERIEYLQKCEADRRWITRHDSKIRRSLAIYLAGMVFVGAAGYSLNFGKTGSRLDSYFFEKVIIRELEKKPDNPQLYKALGDLLYSKKRYSEAIDSYEQSIIYNANSPEVLNNLAWLYATCDDKKFRNPKRALELAIIAVSLKQSPHILDTLAESYYVNGLINEAISTELRAMKSAKKNRSYYEKQLEKFVKAENFRGQGSGV